MTGKTIPADELRTAINFLLSRPDEELLLNAPGKEREATPAEAFRMGAIAALEYTLHITGSYQGFGYADDDPTADETRRVYF